jgi:hypothetical protein
VTNFFPNLKSLAVIRCGLKCLKREDLIEYGNLEKLILDGNKIQALTENVFMYTTDLKYISLAGNRINFIDENIFNCLWRIEMMNLKFNPGIDSLMKLYPDESSKSIHELRYEIALKWSEDPHHLLVWQVVPYADHAIVTPVIMNRTPDSIQWFNCNAINSIDDFVGKGLMTQGMVSDLCEQQLIHRQLIVDNNEEVMRQISHPNAHCQQIYSYENYQNDNNDEDDCGNFQEQIENILPLTPPMTPPISFDENHSDEEVKTIDYPEIYKEMEEKY